MLYRETVCSDIIFSPDCRAVTYFITMEKIKNNQDTLQIGTLQKVEGMLAKLKDPTAESVEKEFGGILTAKETDLKALMSFTGYYSLNKVQNAFLSIDTSIIYINYPFSQKKTIKLQMPSVTINVSLDGKTVTQYPFDSNASFDGKTLTIPNVLQVTLTRGYKDGQLVALSGKVGITAVTGSTNFNPVELPVFVGNYKEITSLKTILTVADSAIQFDFGSGLKNVAAFSYNPAMYVIQFASGTASYTLMLGTAAKQGLACFIASGQSNDFAVTIL